MRTPLYFPFLFSLYFSFFMCDVEKGVGIFVLQVKWRKKHKKNLGFGSTRILRRQKAETLSEK